MAKIWAIADLHLAISTPTKSMEVFGTPWKDYHRLIKSCWIDVVQDEDIVLLPGDISWAKRFEDALVDLNWIDSLPGEKILLKGNHDYWWPSKQKLTQSLPKGMHYIQQTVFNRHGVSISGTRLWDSPEFDFSPYIGKTEAPVKLKGPQPKEESEKIFFKELKKLEESLALLDPKAPLKIAMTHYPPIGVDMKPTKASDLLEKYGVNICVFGHLHNLLDTFPGFKERNGVDYRFVAADFLSFKPQLIAEI